MAKLQVKCPFGVNGGIILKRILKKKKWEDVARFVCLAIKRLSSIKCMQFIELRNYQLLRKYIALWNYLM